MSGEHETLRPERVLSHVATDLKSIADALPIKSRLAVKLLQLAMAVDAVKEAIEPDSTSSPLGARPRISHRVPASLVAEPLIQPAEAL